MWTFQYTVFYRQINPTVVKTHHTIVIGVKYPQQNLFIVRIPMHFVNFYKM